jgi:hypothetical protein
MKNLPKNLIEYLNTEEGSIYLRADVDRPYIEREIHKLGVVPGPTFMEYYEIVDGVYHSDSTHYEILGFEDYEYESVLSQTKAVRKHHNFPDKYVWFADAVDLAGLVLDSETDFVYEVHFEGATDDLLEGKLEPTWKSFKECLSDIFEQNI